MEGWGPFWNNGFPFLADLFGKYDDRNDNVILSSIIV